MDLSITFAYLNWSLIGGIWEALLLRFRAKFCGLQTSFAYITEEKYQQLERSQGKIIKIIRYWVHYWFEQFGKVNWLKEIFANEQSWQRKTMLTLSVIRLNSPFKLLLLVPWLDLNHWYFNTSSDPKKSRISLWKLINFDSKNQFQQNKQIKLKLSNHDNTQFVWV